jgi:hypothetical protein
MRFTLTEYQAAMCHCAALKFRSKTERIGREPRYNSKLNFHEQISELAESLAAEWIVADYFGIPYDPMESTMKEKADVGNGIEVKWTQYSTGHLIVYPPDREMDVAVLVTGKHPNYAIAGWIPVAMAKKPRYKKSDQESWWVGAANLQPIENLRRSSYGETAI